MRALIVVFVLFSCTSQEDSGAKINEYYSLDSLVNAQVQLLVNKNPRLEKVVQLNGDVEDTILQFGPEEWENEFKLFAEADINVPSFSGVYRFDQKLDDPHSNLNFDRYVPIEDSKVRIRSLEIYYYQTIDQIKKIVIEEFEENELYFSSKMLELSFATIQDKSVISGYQIQGLQKLLTRDSVFYKIEGSVLSD